MSPSPSTSAPPPPPDARSAQQLFVKAAAASGGGPSDAAEAGGCPVSREERDRWLAAQQQQQSQQEEARHAARINMPFVPNAPQRQDNSGSKKSGTPTLSTERLASSIPIADPSSVPAHQQGPAAPAPAAAAAASAVHSSSDQGGSRAVWMYPSEQQFFNAMERKGWQPQAQDMPAVVAIHNAVNERAWAHVLAWEALHACECAEPKLTRFRGRPKDYSPKARLLNLLGYKLPFDRHDWEVDRCGRPVRYVIDFYSGASSPAGGGGGASMHLDVRPALDSFGAAVDRLRMQWHWVASGRWREP